MRAATAIATAFLLALAAGPAGADQGLNATADPTANPTSTATSTATPTSSPSTSTMAAHPEPFDSASLPRGYAQDGLRAAGPESRGTPTHPLRLASRPRLTLDLPLHASLAAGALLLNGGLALLEGQLTPAACRWCAPPQVDRWSRGALRWSDPAAAATASDVLLVAVPAGAALALGLRALDGPGARREALEDLVVVAEAVSLALLGTQVAKYAASRERPYAWAGGGSTDPYGRTSFWSGHTAFTFAVATGYAQVARLRGRPGWRWQAALLVVGAGATGFLRVAGDRHWLTDVAVGALAGTAAGLAVPLLAFRQEGASAPALALVPAPGGLALLF